MNYDYQIENNIPNNIQPEISENGNALLFVFIKRGTRGWSIPDLIGDWSRTGCAIGNNSEWFEVEFEGSLQDRPMIESILNQSLIQDKNDGYISDFRIRKNYLTREE